MYEYSFRNSALCHKIIEPNPQSHAFQQLLPPDSQLPKLTKQSANIQNLQDNLNKKSEEIKSLSQKNHQLIIMLNQKQAERVKINKKYNQLLAMYDELKQSASSVHIQSHLQILTDENKSLSERIRKLQRDLLESEKQLVKKVKFYQDKNQDSRKLLQKLNENITKREQKFKTELQQTQIQLRKKCEQYMKLEQQYRNLSIMHGDKQDQLTRLLQQTERDKSAFSQNVSTIEGKLQCENNRLIEQVTFLSEIIEQHKIESANIIKQLNENIKELQKQNSIFKPKLQTVSVNLQQISNRYDQLQIKYKQQEGKNKILNAQVQEIQGRLAFKQKQLDIQRQQMTTIQKHIDKLKHEYFEVQQKYQKLQIANKESEEIVAFHSDQIQKLKQVLKSKIQHIADLQIAIHQQKIANTQSTKLVEQLESDNKYLVTALKKQNKKVNSLEELLDQYKKQRPKIRSQMQRQWTEMTEFYQKQIQKLSNRILQSQSRTNIKFSPPKIQQSSLGKQLNNY